MKKLIVLLLIAFSFMGANSQSITSILPSYGTVIEQLDSSDVRVEFKTTLDASAYMVVFSVDPIGKTKVLKGKNNNFFAGLASWDWEPFSWKLPVSLDGISEGPHTLRVDVYGTSFRDLVDSQEIEFTIKYINP